MPTLNLNNINKLYYGNTEAQKLYKGSQLLYPANLDPYFDNVVLYLKGDGTNNSTDIIDSSPNPKVITRLGDVVISTAQSKYGGTSIFQGTNGYLSVPMTYTNDFTIESWIFPMQLSSLSFLCGTWSSGNWHFNITSGTINIFINTHWTVTANIPLNQWSHVALSRQFNNLRLFVNGVTVGNTLTAAALTGNNMQIFKRPSDSHYFRGYIDSFRFTSLARYTTNFNPETDTYLAY